jgi:hypothetical protein
MVIPPLVVFIGPLVQLTLGEFIRSLMTDTLQISVYVSPAMEIPEVSIPTWIISEETADNNNYQMNGNFRNC